MTIGTATVASTNVRSTGSSRPSHSPSTRLRAVRVGKTAIQIMRASWCFVGGPTVGAGLISRGRVAEDMRDSFRSFVRRKRGTRRRSGGVALAVGGEGPAHVVLDQVGVDVQRGG